MRVIREEFTIENFNKVAIEVLRNIKEVSPIDWPFDIALYSYYDSSVWTFRVEDEDEIVAYSVFRVGTHPHYNKLVAQQDVLYVKPEYRKGSFGIRFIKDIESSLKELSVEGIFQNSTVKKDLSKLFNRIGYKEVDTVYFKEL